MMYQAGGAGGLMLAKGLGHLSGKITARMETRGPTFPMIWPEAKPTDGARTVSQAFAIGTNSYVSPQHFGMEKIPS